MAVERSVAPTLSRVGMIEPTARFDDPGTRTESNLFERNGLRFFALLEEDPPRSPDAAPVAPALHPAAGDGDDDAVNQRLQQIEQEDLQAIRLILGRPIRENAITQRYYWMILKKLRGILPSGASLRVPHGQEYARVLERMARLITIPTEEDYLSAACSHPLGFQCALQALQDRTPDFAPPLDFGEALDQLLLDLTDGYSLMSTADGVFIVKNREEYARRLRALARRL